MAIATYRCLPGWQRQALRHTDASAANTLLALTTPAGQTVRLLFVAVAYSAAPTHAGVTVELDSGAGAASDATLNTPAANARYTFYNPPRELIVADTDAIRVTAPAGGVGITSAITIITEPVL